MSWAAITEANLLTRISGAELEALRAAALADGQVDPVAPSIAHVTGEVRGYVAGCKDNLPLPTDTTLIPDRCMGHAVIMTIAEIIARVPGYDLDADRERLLKRAYAVMDDVASCKFSVDDYDTGADPAGGNVEVVNNVTRHETRENLNGL
jgi:hypothetical protein